MNYKGSVGASTTYVVAVLLCLNLLSSTMVSSHKGHIPSPPLPRPSPPPPSPRPSPPPPSPSQTATCPTLLLDPLMLRACVSVLNVTSITVGEPFRPCCDLIQGLPDVQASACICLALRASVSGIINTNLTLALTTTLGNCGRNSTGGYQCT